MLSVDPQGVIKLCKTPLEEDQQNQINFASAEAQLSYFNSTVQRTLENYTYVKEDGIICVEVPYDEAINYNYLFYRNTGFSNKYWFCFITKVEYVNENTSNLYIKTDVWQTFHLSLNYTQCFVEREHVADDTKGLHTVAEGLEIGDYIINDTVVSTNYLGNNGTWWLAMMVSDFPFDSSEIPDLASLRRRIYTGMYSGCYLLFFPTSDAGLDNMEKWIQAYDGAGKGNAIYSIFYIPKAFIGETTSATFTTELGCEIPNQTLTPYTLTDVSLTQKATIDGFTPHNNKLYCYPYSYFYITNNGGASIEYTWEDFNGNPNFTTKSSISAGCSIKCYPTNYKRSTNLEGFSYGLTGGKLPLASWNSDTYTNWLSQNGTNLAFNAIGKVIGSVAGGATSAATGNPFGGVQAGLGIADAIFGTLGEIDKASHLPDQIKGDANAGDIAFSSGRYGFSFYRMSIRYEYAVICDKYFDMFGYKVNTVKVPAITSRLNWNYVKTIGCNFTGNGIPQQALEEIRGFFNKGITIWHNTSTFGDYSQNNSIVS